MRINENLVEQAALQWFSELGYEVAFGPDISPGGERPERDSFGEVVLAGRLRAALRRLNPLLSDEAVDDALHQVFHLDSPNLAENNRRFHAMLRDGVKVEVVTSEGEGRGDLARLFDYNEPENNDWLVVNQFTVVVGEDNRRPDIVVFINGLPLGILELKNPLVEQATVKGAFQQLQTYKQEIPDLFQYNEVLVVSDSIEARHGTITSDWERLAPWRTIEGENDAPEDLPHLEVLICGVFEKRRFLNLVQNFVVFESDGDRLYKKMAMYQQFHAVNAAVEETIRATCSDDEPRVGVIWHTQGSGKSLSMVFYAAKVMRHPAMNNPTVLVLTDRNDLDNQIYRNFCLAQDLIPYPKQAESVEDLKQLLTVPAGGVIFTTVQKFKPKEGENYPLLSERRNIIVIADEAHRSHYNFMRGYARYIREGLPNAAFIGFTGTPIELEDRSTRQVFGDYISIYDIQRSIEDGATVPIYYEGRLAKLHLTNEFIDEDFEEITEREEEHVKESLKRKWARLEKLVGAEDRLRRIAQDIVEHYTERCKSLEGKAMIVCMSRRICVDLYNHLTSIPGCPQTAVVMTGSASDPPEFQPHIRNKAKREKIKERFKDPGDPLRLVIVRDMWLTGFDNPCLHTMYADKPMKGHTLMQAIARVNRVFRDKPGGLIVDYLGIADDLRRALSNYSDKDRNEALIPLDQAVAVLKEKYDIVRTFFHGVNYRGWRKLAPAALTQLLQKAHNAVVADEDTKSRFIKACTELTKAFALVIPHPEAMQIRDDVAFFQSVRKNVVKYTPPAGQPPEELDTAVKQLISEAVAASEVVDIFGAAEMKRPDISILSDEFLAEVQGMEHKNLQVELLRKLLEDEITAKMRKNVVKYRSFKEMLEQVIKAYQNRSIQSAEVIAKLVELAKELREVEQRGEILGLSDEEMAFYDAVAKGEEHIRDDEHLRTIARELVASIKGNLSIDWADHENVKAKIRATVRRLLRRHGYPPTECEVLVLLIMEQAESLYRDWPKAA